MKKRQSLTDQYPEAWPLTLVFDLVGWFFVMLFGLPVLLGLLLFVLFLFGVLR